MKTFLLVLFKILELAGLVASYFLFAIIGNSMLILISNEDLPNWYDGICFLTGLLLVMIIAFVILIIRLLIKDIIPYWIEANKRFIDKLLK